jgi:hypothetical protein
MLFTKWSRIFYITRPIVSFLELKHPVVEDTLSEIFVVCPQHNIVLSVTRALNGLEFIA